MTFEDFTSSVRDRWKNIPDPVLYDINRELQGFTNEDVSKIWDTFIRTYSLVSPPAFAAIIKAIEVSGCRRARRSGGDRFIWKCECGTYWDDRSDPISGYRCPSCFKLHHYSVAIKYNPQEMKVKWIQQHCVNFWKDDFDIKKDDQELCDKYGQVYASGPVCTEWGTDHQGDECYNCKCLQCCRKTSKENKEMVKVEQDMVRNTRRVPE